MLTGPRMTTPTTRRFLRSSLFLAALLGSACGEGVVTTGGVGEPTASTEQGLNPETDDLYAKLRAAEELVQPPPPIENILVGTLNASTGTFTGLTSWWDTSGFKPRQIIPLKSVNAIEPVLVFNVVGASGITLTINGVTTTSSGSTISFNPGVVQRVNWTLSAGAYTRSDSLNLSYPVVGVGAFTVSALPITLAYEPPMNLARTNRATLNFRQEMTVINTVTNSTTSSRASFAGQGLFRDLLNRAQPRFSSPEVRGAITVINGILGSATSTTTTGTTVNSDSSLGLTHFSDTTYSTNALLGPGLGDVVVFYKNARLAWVLVDGKVSLTLLDRGHLMMVTVDLLRNELATARAGYPAPVTGLDATSLEALIRLDPLATTRITAGDDTNLGATLAAPRFRQGQSLTINGVSFTQTVGHTITQVDTTTTQSTTSTVTECHRGWLSMLGIGETRNGTYTTTTTLGTSRTESVSSTASAQYSLQAAANEAYTLDVYYDTLFGSFLTRKPQAPLYFFGFGP